MKVKANMNRMMNNQWKSQQKKFIFNKLPQWKLQKGEIHLWKNCWIFEFTFCVYLFVSAVKLHVWKYVFVSYFHQDKVHVLVFSFYSFMHNYSNFHFQLKCLCFVCLFVLIKFARHYIMTALNSSTVDLSVCVKFQDCLLSDIHIELQH